jgi:hypothetical protein
MRIDALHRHLMGVVCLSIPLWEVRYPDGSQPIGWHTVMIAVIVFLLSQYLFRPNCQAIHPLIV